MRMRLRRDPRESGGRRMPDRIRVLIAEDLTVVREGTRHILERAGDMQVVGEAADGWEAVAIAERLRPDVVIMDIAMPRLSGIEATRRIKAARPEVGVLVLTVHGEDQYVFALLEAGAAGYLLKDVHATDLVGAVRAVKAGESVLHPEVARKVLRRFVPGRERAPGDGAGELLTERELQVLKMAARGMTNKAIARGLGLSTRTVQAHLGHVFQKLGVASRTEAVIRGLRQGWFGLEELADDGP